MINWLLLVPAALVIVILAFLWARTAVDRFKLRTFSQPDSKSRANALARAEHPKHQQNHPQNHKTTPTTQKPHPHHPKHPKTKRAETLEINPCVPADWKEFSIEYRHGDSTYTITVRNPSGVQKGIASVTVDGTTVSGPISLVSDGQPHEVIVTMG
jgi:hypothetical protein